MVKDITSRDSKRFHINLLGCKNSTFYNVAISALEESLNTDGIHIGRSSGINITDSTIETGDDCVSIGDDSEQINIQRVTYGPGHGISVGSLGKYPHEEPVVGISVKNCTSPTPRMAWEWRHGLLPIKALPLKCILKILSWIIYQIFCEGCTKFCKGCTKVAKVHFEVENDLQSLPEGLQMKKWTMGREISVSLAQRLDASNFLNDVPRVPKSVSK